MQSVGVRLIRPIGTQATDAPRLIGNPGQCKSEAKIRRVWWCAHETAGEEEGGGEREAYRSALARGVRGRTWGVVVPTPLPIPGRSSTSASSRADRGAQVGVRGGDEWMGAG